MRKNCSCDREKLLKFEAEGREFANILRSVEQFILTVKGQYNLQYIKTIIIQIGKNNWDLENYRER